MSGRGSGKLHWFYSPLTKLCKTRQTDGWMEQKTKVYLLSIKKVTEVVQIRVAHDISSWVILTREGAMHCEVFNNTLDLIHKMIELPSPQQ